MSYPPPQYFGSTGEKTARFRPADTPPELPLPGHFEGLVELAEGRWKPSHDELQAFFEEHDNIYV